MCGPTNPVFAVEMVLVSLLVAALIGAVLGYLSSYPAIRLREDYLGMLLLGSAQFFQVVLRTYEPLIGGTQPIFVPDPYYYWAQLGTGYRDLVAAIVMSVFAIIVYMFAERMVRSPLGRKLRAIRDNETAARALGPTQCAAASWALRRCCKAERASPRLITVRFLNDARRTT